MGLVIKQSIRSSAIAYLGVAIGYVNLLWLFPYFLTSDQIGLLRLIQSSSFILATFGQFGLPQTAVRFFPELRTNKGLVTFLMLGGLLGFLILVVVSLLFQNQILAYFSQESALFIQYFEVTLFVTLFLVQFQILEAFSRSHLKIVFPTLIRDIQLRLFTTILVICFALELVDFSQMVNLLVVVYATLVISIIIYLISIKAIALSFNFNFLRGGTFKRLIRYGFYSLLGAGGTQIVLQIDSVMVSGELGLKATGIYAIAFFIGVVIEMPKRAITQVSSALISQAFDKGQMNEVRKLYRQTSINQFIIGALLLIGIWANLENIYLFIPNNEEYLTGMGVVLFIGLGKLSDLVFGVNGEIIVMSRYYRFNVVAISFLAALTILLNLWLIPIYGLEGAAMASFMAMFLFNLVKFIFVYWRFRIGPFNLKTLVFAFIAIAAVLANSLIPSLSHVIPDILLRSSIITIIIVGGAYAFEVSPEMNGLIRTYLNKIRKRH